MKYESMNCSSGRDSESHETTSDKTIRTIQNFRMNHLAIQDYQSWSGIILLNNSNNQQAWSLIIIYYYYYC